MRFIFLNICLLLASIGCSSSCPEQTTFSVGPDGGTYEYCNWKFIVPKGAVSQTTEFTVQKSQTTSIKNTTLVGLENPQTGELEAIPVELDTAPGFETIEVGFKNPNAITNSTAIAICPEGEVMVSERIGIDGNDTTATPITGLGKQDPCFELFTNNTNVNQPVYVSAAGMDWSDAWNRLISNSTNLYNKYIINGYKLHDPCVLCSYTGFALSSNLVGSDCKEFVKGTICKIVAAPITGGLSLIWPLNKLACAAANSAITYAINYTTSKLSLPNVDSICKLIDTSTGSQLVPLPVVRDTMGCGFQKACSRISSCSSESLDSGLIKNNISKCQELGF